MEGISKPEKSKVIICNGCKQSSGYSNEDIKDMKTAVSKHVLCMNCGHPCIKLLGPDVRKERRIGLPTLRKLDL